MSPPKRTEPNPEYELAPDGKPAVGFSKGKDGYYFLIYLSHFLQSIPDDKAVLVQTKNGIDYELVNRLDVKGNEATVRVMPDGEMLIVGTRQYLKDQARTSVFSLSLDGKFEKLFHFDSGADTSYPGMLIHDDKLWVSFYSSHEEKTSIYLGSIPVADL